MFSGETYVKINNPAKTKTKFSQLIKTACAFSAFCGKLMQKAAGKVLPLYGYGKI